ncbi:MAG: c-type cytochrome [Bdellovibrionales bacterium]|nr:c-type cytochrome [Bdellovibrionales bacterium]
MEEDKVLSHEYDGIQEYDNDLPRWWVWMFWGWIVFGVIYVGYYHYGPGTFPRQDVALEMKQAEEAAAQVAAEQAASQPEMDDAFFLAQVKIPEVIAKGSEVFTAKCVACHGAAGEGIVGPNLTDEYWIHGGAPTDIHNVILKGVLEKGMLAWESQLTKDELVAVTSYVISIEGTNPPNAKEPQGEKVE